ncbi:MAG TPA: dihydrofolate reductase family protein [Polyangiaceae bacterium]|nr:dihydrofolate reductase family protein [Polyangiaceae bacterium]
MILDAPLETLFERTDLPRFDLPPSLQQAYGGAIGFRKPCVFANFVTSVDGVVALPEPTESGHIISKSSRADRFVMGLLRACADTVMVGAGTFRKTRGARFRADAIYPDGAAAFAELRARLGLAPAPRFVVVTRSGNIDTGEPALDGALVVTSRAGEAALRGRVSPNTEVVALGADTLLLADVVALLRKRGAESLLTEGGPSFFAEAASARLVDELFVTTSPALFGRFTNDRRKSLADGMDLGGLPMELVSAKRHGSYLFLRYAF